MSNIVAAPARELTKLPPERRGEVPIAPTTDSNFTFAFYWSLIRRRLLPIAAFVLATVVAVTLVVLSLPKEYESTVMIRVDPMSSGVVGDSQGQAASGQDAQDLVTTESLVAKSPAVVEEAISTLHLDQIPEFARASAVGGRVDRDRLLRAVTGRISIDQPLGTMLLEIGFRARSPQLAAEAANGVAQAFVEHEYVTRSHALMASSQNMSSQLDSLRAQMERDQLALVNYQSTHDVLDPDDSKNIFASRLQEINDDLTKAQASRIQYQADFGLAQSESPDALLASSRGQMLVPLEQRVRADKRELNQLSTVYGTNHPKYRQQLSTENHDEEALQQEEQHVRMQIEQQYSAAITRENLLGAALDAQKQATDAFNMRAIRYHALKAAADSSASLYKSLQQHIQDAEVAAGLHAEDLRIVSPAMPSERPVFPRPLYFGALAFLAAAAIGVGATIILGLADQTLSSPEQVELRLRQTVLASLPDVPDLTGSRGLLANGPESPDGVVERHPAERRSPFDEAILGLHSTLRFAAPESPVVLAVSSSVPGEGKSTAVAHLAAAYRVLGARVVLVDADMRKANVHRLFGINNRIGLSSVLRKKSALESAIAIGPGEIRLVPAGPTTSSPAELLQLGIAGVIDQLRDQFDVVLLDCPPTLGFADAAAVAAASDGVILIVRAGSTDQRTVQGALRALQSVRAQILGVVLNRVSAKLDSYYTYQKGYYYYRDAGQEEEDS